MVAASLKRWLRSGVLFLHGEVRGTGSNISMRHRDRRTVTTAHGWLSDRTEHTRVEKRRPTATPGAYPSAGDPRAGWLIHFVTRTAPGLELVPGDG